MSHLKALDGGGSVPRTTPDALRCPGCGCEWFRLDDPGVLALDGRQQVRAYSGALICDDCERPYNAPPPSLVEVPT